VRTAQLTRSDAVREDAPVVGRSRSAIIRKMVDFPQPDGPSNALKLPSGALSETDSSACTARFLDPKVLVTESSTNPAGLS
jgi:hypothetical protein